MYSHCSEKNIMQAVWCCTQNQEASLKLKKMWFDIKQLFHSQRHTKFRIHTLLYNWKWKTSFIIHTLHERNISGLLFLSTVIWNTNLFCLSFFCLQTFNHTMWIFFVLSHPLFIHHLLCSVFLPHNSITFATPPFLFLLSFNYKWPQRFGQVIMLTVV